MIFKYYAPTSHALSNLSDKRIICRHYSDFNDPFEFWSRINAGVPDLAQDRNRFLDAVKAWGFTEDMLREALEHHAEYFGSLEGAQPNFPRLFDHMRVACFATARTNLLMWSHYGDGLRGFCVGFDPDALMRPEQSTYLATVRYLSEPPPVDSFVYAVAEDQYAYHLMALEELAEGHDTGVAPEYQKARDEAFSLMTMIWESAFAAKPMEWTYEQEKRLLIHTDEGGCAPIFLDYPSEAVKEVIVGERMPAEFRADLMKAVRSAYGNVPLYVACRDRDTYCLRFEQAHDLERDTMSRRSFFGSRDDDR